jgi:hypothetical protein
MLKIYKNDILDILSVLRYDKKEELIKSASIYFLLYAVSFCEIGVLYPPVIPQA